MTTIHCYCIFHEAPDKQPAWHDANGFPVTYATYKEAVAEICDDLTEQIRQIKDGDRDLEELYMSDWIEDVTVDEKGIVTDEDGRQYGKRQD